MRFDIAYGLIGPLLGLLGMGKSRSHVNVDDTTVEARMGWAFNATIERAGRLGAGQAVLVKVARPVQDPRLDCPAVGPRTIEHLARAGFSALAIETGRTIVIGGSACLARADELGIAVLGIDPAAVQPVGHAEREKTQ